MSRHDRHLPTSPSPAPASRATAEKRAGKLRGGPDALFGRWLARRILGRLERGRLVVVTPEGDHLVGEGGEPGTEATLVIGRWRAMRRLAIGGDIGFAEAYIDGDWSSPDLSAMIALGAENVDALERICAGNPLVRLIERLRHRRNGNSKAGSRRNIAFHYDLGNDFYRLWLDDSMTYSSALYDDPAMSLEAAQSRKIAEVLRQLDIRGGERVLEIGSGWGALAMELARRGAHVTTLTLSREQHDHVVEAAARAGLSDRVEVRLQDYRDVTGTFDRIVSIEMLEAVGEEYWPAYFAKLRSCLAPAGKAVLQVITIREERYDAYRRGADFIQRHVFPGGMLPTPAAIRHHVGAVGLGLVGAHTFGDSYRLTLAEWRRRFLAAWPRVESLGFGPSFRRLWEYYLGYCEAGFRTGMIDVGLYALAPIPVSAAGAEGERALTPR